MQNYSPYSSNNDIAAFIDAKISQNNEMIFNEQRENISYLSTQLESHETRISNIELKPGKGSVKRTKSGTEGDWQEDSSEETQELAEEMNRKSFHEDVEVDTYLYLTLAFSFTSLHLFWGYFKIICGDRTLTFWQRMGSFCTVLMAPLVLLPGFATTLIQLYCVYYVYEEAQSTFTTKDKRTNMALKIIILIIFLFMVAKEVSQANNSFFYALIKARNKKSFFYSLCFLPSMIQACMGFIILYVGFLLIASTDDPINLIQNFASVYVLLEIDNIMMNFIKMSKLSLCINSVNSKLDLLRRRLGAVPIFSKNVIMKMMVEDHLDTDFADHPEYKTAFLIARTCLLAFLLVFAVSSYIYEILLGTTTN